MFRFISNSLLGNIFRWARAFLFHFLCIQKIFFVLKLSVFVTRTFTFSLQSTLLRSEIDYFMLLRSYLFVFGLGTMNYICGLQTKTSTEEPLVYKWDSDCVVLDPLLACILFIYTFSFNLLLKHTRGFVSHTGSLWGCPKFVNAKCVQCGTLLFLLCILVIEILWSGSNFLFNTKFNTKQS